jgi:5-deoxy-glucuronate isomerase
MSKLLVKPHAPGVDGCILEVTPETAGWQYVGFKVCRLTVGQTLTGLSGGVETCIVVLSGSADVMLGESVSGSIGGRPSVFTDAAPGAAYVPAGTRYSITARGEIELALCTAPGRPGRPPRIIRSESMPHETRGKGSNTRFVRNILPEQEAADSLLVVEVITPGGHWSSYPPHKHDCDIAGVETALEETYYHRLNPAAGFALQRVYTDDRSLDETLCVDDGTVVLVPRGYHPVAAASGYDLYYLNVMAGPRRGWKFRTDPTHEWLLRTQ